MTYEQLAILWKIRSLCQAGFFVRYVYLPFAGFAIDSEIFQSEFAKIGVLQLITSSEYEDCKFVADSKSGDLDIIYIPLTEVCSQYQKSKNCDVLVIPKFIENAEWDI